MTVGELLALRLKNQQLVNPSFSTTSELVKWFGAMQSQDYPNALWGVSQRLNHLGFTALEKAFNAGKILRTHVMRPTWHFVHPEDIEWMLRLTGPRVTRIMSSYSKKLELSDDIFKKSQQVFIDLLRNKKVATREELKLELTNIGIKTDVQRLGHIVGQAELDLILISGPRIGKTFTYMLFSERVPKTPRISREDAVTRLVYRYFQSHGPATIKDFVWWSGLTVLDAKLGIEANTEITSTMLNSKTYYFIPRTVPDLPQGCFLLPNYDEYGIAYAEREAFYDPSYTTLLTSRGNATFQHLILVDGRIVGTWRREIKKKSVIIQTNFFATPSPSVRDAIRDEADRYGAFLNLPVELQS